MAWYWTVVVTLGATEWFITAVVPFKSLQSAWCWTFFVTLRAAEWFITSVGSFMSLQMAWYWTFEVPLGANECFFTGVNSFMSLQIAWCWGMGATEWCITFVGSFLCKFKINSCVLSSMLKTELTYRYKVLFLIMTQTYQSFHMPSKKLS